METKKTKIYILIFPDTGHVNPIAGIVEVLVKNKNCDVVFYGRKGQKDLIERTGAQFRQYRFYRDGNSISKPLKEDPFTNDLYLFTDFINLSYQEIPLLIQDIEIDKPDLIIYDQLSIPAKYLLRIMEINFKNRKSSMNVPPSVQIYTCFPCKAGVYPTEDLLEKFPCEPTGFLYNLEKYILKMKQLTFSLYFGIDFIDPFELWSDYFSDLNIVTLIPEIQPMSENFGSSFKFVGSCVSENVHKNNITDSKLVELLYNFSPLNPCFEKNNRNYFKLIYASLGTVFNNNIFIFDIIIEAIKELNKEMSNIKVVLGVGKDNFNIYETRRKIGSYIVPDNVSILSYAPQIEILERASLFITHCGMNSASEAIQLGVPIIGIPIKADQPLVAYRLCDELNLGIRFEPLTFNHKELKNGIKKVLNDDSYMDRILEFTKISRKYNGSQNAADFIIDYLNKKN
ncbi:unnamed protein product [Brachionus calyciflorus]|uniref:UDP-glucuronosyltransferase n=1 Tax=Brachionus calyciflorus TaxID=104777 RepID=A0A813M9W0_9BILA|nr:unnamed protein product [Brachionus calyciflorus]